MVISIYSEEILKGTQLGLANHKVVKWIIEVAALMQKKLFKYLA
jgi:deoxyribose-phosphate aldolase